MKQQGNILIILAIIAALTTGAIIYFKSNSFSTPQPTSTPRAATSSDGQIKTFQSKNLKFTINIPAYLQIEEKFTTVILKSNNTQIVLSRIATNFENLEDYLNDLSIKNKLVIEDREVKTINNLNSVTANIKASVNRDKNEKVYFIYVDNWIYSLTTDSESLYDDLDQIAQSFKYTP